MQVVVGRIGRAHGIHGDVSVDVRTDEPERRLAPGAVLLTDPEARRPAHHRRRPRAQRPAAAAVRGRGGPHRGRGAARHLLLVEIDPAELPEDEDEWYDHQLVGLAAVGLTAPRSAP